MKKRIIKYCAMACLLMTIFLTWQYNEYHYPGAAGKSGSEKSESPLVEKQGTWCTLKSNALEGVPVYDQAGSTLQTGLIPEGHCCQLIAEITKEGRAWSQVSYCGLTGWMEKENLHFISDEDRSIKEGGKVFMWTITEKGIRAYEKPSASSKEVADGIVYGDEFTVDKLESGWGRTRINGKEAWINMFHMADYSCKRWKVQSLSSAQGVNLRQKPGPEQKILTKIPESTELSMKEFDHGWGHVSYNGHDGWVMLRYLIPAP